MKHTIKILAALFGILLLFTACGSAKEPGPLRICIECTALRDTFQVENAVQNFLSNAVDYGVIESVDDVEFEVIPYGLDTDPERKGVLTRLRTEIASGEGPDIFIIGRTANGAHWNDDTLFRYPERAIAQNRFLKLDDYIADAQFMEWDKLFAPVMEAGRTEDGQFLLPMTYSFYATIFNGSDSSPELSASTAWQDMLESSDPLVQCAGRLPEYNSGCLPSVFGRLTEKQSDTLSLSKEQMQKVFDTGRSHFQSPEPEGLPEHYSANLIINFESADPLAPADLSNWDMTIVPMCSLNGGVTAMVTSFCGINANTKRPKEAFALLDLLLFGEFQQYSGLYGGFLFEGLPVQDGLMGEDTPVQHWHFSDNNYQAFLDARNLITDAQFPMPSDRLRTLSMGYAQYVRGEEDSGVVDEVYRDMEMGLAES